jgi:hypothetical protein
MGLLQVIDDAPGYVKATFQGPQGSGKTRTAVELAATTHKLFGCKKPVAFFDTETGSDFVADLIAKMTGQKPVRVKTRAFSDLMAVVRECLNGAAEVLIVDSITHVWRELNDAYLAKVNENSRYKKNRMTIDDIMQVKQQWYPWTDQFLNTPLHIIVCGREGNEWGNEENEETGKRELVQVGKKMKVEAEFGYEASLMVAMHAHQIAEGVVKKRDKTRERRPRSIVNVATVLKDRFDEMNGAVIEFPTGESFMPHLKRLNPSAHVAVDTSVKSGDALGDVGDEGWARDKKTRTILCEEIQGEILKAYPGQSAREKAMKAALIERAFKTRSWTRVESMDIQTLREGLAKVRATLEDPMAFEADVAGAIPQGVGA